jgi:UDP-N-acetylglucosamine 1-carboxyvinyltransferase
MHDVLKIEGKHPLNGTVTVSGSKNATVALIPAAILASGPVTIYGVPHISDVGHLGELLEELGVHLTQNASDQLIIDPTHIQNKVLDHPSVQKLRASYYFMGALLGRFKSVAMKMPGGCYLGPRPIDLHLKGFEALGATVEFKQGAYHIFADQLVGAKIYLDIASVGATINIMMAAVHALGRTTIENAAKEPEIIDVANMLNEMGAHVRGAGTSIVTIDGVDRLNGCVHEIIPDRIEAGTFIIMAAAAAQKVTVQNIIPQHLESLLSKLQEMGVHLDIEVDRVTVSKADELQAVDIQTLSYPGYATDLQQPITPLLTQATGQSQIKETIYVERFKHCIELQRMGANIELTPAIANITGPTPLYGEKVTATDLRAGAALVIAGLLAEGVTEIHDVYHIDRGYENIDQKLRDLGAKIWRETVE